MSANLIYNLLRGLHILADIAWMAGLLYLPRLFAYHTKALAKERAPDTENVRAEMDLTFQTMEEKLYRIIMTPAMIVALALGLCLIWRDAHTYAGGWMFLLTPWMATKLVGVAVLLFWHHFLGAARKRFAAGTNQRSEKFWRATNEVPFVAAIVMVLAVTTKFGG